MSKDRFKDWKYPEFDECGLTKWNWMCQHHEHLKLGKNTDIGAFTYINARFKVLIEEGVEVGSHCSIYSISTIDNKEGKVILKKNCRVGSHSVVSPGITIGENSIIGALSLVNKNIPDNVIAHGIPIKCIRKLKDEEINTLGEAL